MSLNTEHYLFTSLKKLEIGGVIQVWNQVMLRQIKDTSLKDDYATSCLLYL